ncbi:hypothetical protein A3L09_10165 [Thermococcus profundus]|uniref:Uncharacterized protein n=1 Tax=Thermococcus profundus TaxID=49899 RepID=A0A2Z2MFU8_THEPR|nr:hypothetical protein [Thermococcus profundus]ASJ03595.1 hypothetical protein A3L09_10165 [Thermococcus profundus]
MIGIAASLALAVYLRSYVPLIGVAVWLLSRRNRDLGLLAYSVYALYIANFLRVDTIYLYIPLVEALAVASSALLLLEDVLRGGTRRDRVEFVLSVLVLGGAVSPELLVAGAVLYLALKLRLDYVSVIVSTALLVFLLLFQESLDINGGASLQVGVVSAFGVFLLLYSLTRINIKKVKMFNLDSKQRIG